MMMMTAMIFATGPSTESSTFWSGASHGIEEPAACVVDALIAAITVVATNKAARFCRRFRTLVMGGLRWTLDRCRHRAERRGSRRLPDRGRPRRQVQQADRKSTRLNSSH